jgi:hypothetical protein
MYASCSFYGGEYKLHNSLKNLRRNNSDTFGEDWIHLSFSPAPGIFVAIGQPD